MSLSLSFFTPIYRYKCVSKGGGLGSVKYNCPVQHGIHMFFATVFIALFCMPLSLLGDRAMIKKAALHALPPNET